jgi:hypothetical protein
LRDDAAELVCPYCKATVKPDAEQAWLFGPPVPEPRGYRFFGYLVLFLAVAVALLAIIAGVSILLAQDSGTFEDALGLNMVFIGVCVVFVGIFVLLICKWLAAIQDHSHKLLALVKKISDILDRNQGKQEQG